MDIALSARNLSKIYPASKNTPPKFALKSLSLDIESGSIFGLLGPNGAGKSTFINIFAGTTTKTAGEGVIFGFDLDSAPKSARAHIGVVPQEINFDAFFTPFEALELQAGFYGVPKTRRRSNEILKALGLYEKKDAYVRSLSGGMKRRLLVAKALVHSPPILVLDEPTAGVDVELRQQLWTYVRQLNEQGTTIILTTHYLEEAQQLCDKIGIINHGELVTCAPTRELLSELDSKILIIEPTNPLDKIPKYLEGLDSFLDENGALHIRFQKSSTSISALIEAYKKSGNSIADLRTVEPDLEDVFVKLTSEETSHEMKTEPVEQK